MMRNSLVTAVVIVAVALAAFGCGFWFGSQQQGRYSFAVHDGTVVRSDRQTGQVRLFYGSGKYRDLGQKGER